MSEKIKKEIISWIKTIAFAFIIALFINNVIIVNANVPTGSMENTIMTNDRIVGFRLSYMFSEPKFGDIITFRNPDYDKKILENPNYLEKFLVKRVIGVSGDKVEIKDGSVYVNDKILEESYLKETMFYYEQLGPYYVPENSYFTLGDNRNNSLDSRYWENTFVYEKDIVAKIYFSYFPKIHWLANK